MNATSEFLDELLRRARQHARASGRWFDVVVEDGHRLVLAAHESQGTYQLPDLRIGDPDAADPLEAYSWQGLRGMSYAE